MAKKYEDYTLRNFIDSPTLCFIGKDSNLNNLGLINEMQRTAFLQSTRQDLEKLVKILSTFTPDVDRVTFKNVCIPTNAFYNFQSFKDMYKIILDKIKANKLLDILGSNALEAEEILSESFENLNFSLTIDKSIIENAIRELKNSINRKISEMEDYQKYICQNMKDISKFHRDIEKEEIKLLHITDRVINLSEQIAKIEAELPLKFVCYCIANEDETMRDPEEAKIMSVQFMTKERLVQRYQNNSSGESYEKDMGLFLFDINLTDKRVRVWPAGYNQNVSGYYHPHIGTEGSPCYGNIAMNVAEYLANCDIYSLLKLLWVGFQQYNPESPYRQLSKFKDKKKQNDFNIFHPKFGGKSSGTNKAVVTMLGLKAGDCVKVVNNSWDFHVGATLIIARIRPNGNIDCVRYRDEAKKQEYLDILNKDGYNGLNSLYCLYTLSGYHVRKLEDNSIEQVEQSVADPD